MGRPINTVGVLDIGRLSSMRDEDFSRYSFEDSTVRVRTVVVARGSGEVSLVDQEVYYTEVSVSIIDV